MKTLLLENVLIAMNIEPEEKHKGISIRKVTHDKFSIDNHTVYFHLRNRRLNFDLIKEYKNVFIVTDTISPDMEKLNPEQVIKVENVQDSLFKFTFYYRHLFDVPVVAVTGTCGKSTTKEMLKHILEEKYTVQATKSSKNADYYHLSYLLGMDEKTDAAVFETAVSKKGDMLEACRYFYPTIGIMTMIDFDHTDKFKSFKDYIEEKAKIMEGLNYEGVLILNTDDPYLSSLDTSSYKGDIMTFGSSEEADFRIKEINYTAKGMSFSLAYKGTEYKGLIPGTGDHNVYNAAAALAGASVMGVDFQYALERITTFKHMVSHFQMIKGQNEVTIIDDNWKSNPASLRKGLETLRDIAAPNQRKIVVLGRMASLGQYADQEYEKAGRLIAELGIDVLITKGSIAKDFEKPAIQAGFNPVNIYHFSDADDMKKFLEYFLKPNDLIYFKTGGNDGVFEDVISFLTQ